MVLRRQTDLYPILAVNRVSIFVQGLQSYNHLFTNSELAMSPETTKKFTNNLLSAWHAQTIAIMIVIPGQNI